MGKGPNRPVDTGLSCYKSISGCSQLLTCLLVVSHSGGPDPVVKKRKITWPRICLFMTTALMNVDLHSRALLSNKRLTKLTQLNIAIGYQLKYWADSSF